MLTKITKTPTNQPEIVEIHCHKVSDEVKEIIAFVKSRQGQLTGSMDDMQFEIPVGDIFYIESVDNKTFAYTQSEVYELRQKHFLRTSKSTLLNLMKSSAIKPALNGRFTAVLFSGEETVISRKYVPELKKALKGEN